MKRKAEAEPAKEEQPKEKKQDTLVKFKAPLWYAYGFGVDSGKIDWKWHSRLPSNPRYEDKQAAMVDEAYDNFREHMGFTCHLRSPTWCFAPEIEPIVFEFFFGSTFHGLASIIAGYAEIVFPGEAAMLDCDEDSWHESNICLVGEWNDTDYKLDYCSTKEAAWRKLRSWEDCFGCESCMNVLRVFTVPYPTTENVI